MTLFHRYDLQGKKLKSEILGGSVDPSSPVNDAPDRSAAYYAVAVMGRVILSLVCPSVCAGVIGKNIKDTKKPKLGERYTEQEYCYF